MAIFVIDTLVVAYIAMTGALALCLFGVNENTKPLVLGCTFKKLTHTYLQAVTWFRKMHMVPIREFAGAKYGGTQLQSKLHTRSIHTYYHPVRNLNIDFLSCVSCTSITRLKIRHNIPIITVHV